MAETVQRLRGEGELLSRPKPAMEQTIRPPDKGESAANDPPFEQKKWVVAANRDEGEALETLVNLFRPTPIPKFSLCAQYQGKCICPALFPPKGPPDQVRTGQELFTQGLVQWVVTDQQGRPVTVDPHMALQIEETVQSVWKL